MNIRHRFAEPSVSAPQQGGRGEPVRHTAAFGEWGLEHVALCADESGIPFRDVSLCSGQHGSGETRVPTRARRPASRGLLGWAERCLRWRGRRRVMALDPYSSAQGSGQAATFDLRRLLWPTTGPGRNLFNQFLGLVLCGLLIAGQLACAKNGLARRAVGERILAWEL